MRGLFCCKLSMEMNTLILPNQFEYAEEAPVQIFSYESDSDVAKKQIILNQNIFSFLTEGNKEVIFDNASIAIDRSKFLIMKAGHCLMTEKLSHVKRYRSILFFFSNEALAKLTQKLELTNVKSNQHQSVYAFSCDDFIEKFIASLTEIYKLEKKVQTALLEIKLQEIVLYLIAIYGNDFLKSLSNKANSNSQRFTQTIESNALQKLSLQELAFLCNMSLSTFKREFEKHYGQSPSKWFQKKRLLYANHLLTTQDKTATEVYQLAGYENLSSFIQAYKIQFGHTPKQSL